MLPTLVPAVDNSGGGAVTRDVRQPAAFGWGLPIVIAAAILAACSGGGDRASLLDAAAFREAYDQLERTIEGGRAGDADGAEEAFAEVRGFLRELTSVLAAMPGEVIVRAELLDAVTRIERELAGERRPDVLADIAEDARRSLAEVGKVLAGRTGQQEAE